MKNLKAKTAKANKALDQAFGSNQITAIEYKNAREATRLSFCRAIERGDYVSELLPV